MKVPLLDLKRQYQSIRKDVDAAVGRVMESQFFILGPEVEAFEKEMAAYCGTKHAVGVASGTDGLLLALMAMGVGPGDEVVTSPFTFIATAESISRLGAKPVFVDIDPDTYNIRPDLIAQRITPRTKAILPVHLYGQCAEMDEINALARPRGLKVVEDTAQAVGADYKGRKSCSLGDAGCLSFFPSKNLGGAGDGGMVLTNDEGLAAKVRLLRAHGARQKYFHDIHGVNSRLDALQAAVLRVKLPHLDAWIRGRREKAAYYDQGLRAVARTPVVRHPHVYHQYVIRVKNRDGLAKHLEQAGIGFGLYYPLPLHLQKCYAELGYKEGDLPASESAARDTIALPIFPELTREEQDYVISQIKAFAGRS
ncbi:MAG: DegT/DnrJ/EryC1/StrS family aminotransferase [Planctomycetes bacterium]|nr:DegT/DnrJ/EryC1/StrS family aminotransferase [Planctomycetota bacterium]